MLECGGKLLLAMIYDIFIIKWKLPITLFLKNNNNSTTLVAF